MNSRPRSLLVYSSVTGNTRRLAEAIHQIMPEGTPIFPVQKAPGLRARAAAPFGAGYSGGLKGTVPPVAVHAGCVKGAVPLETGWSEEGGGSAPSGAPELAGVDFIALAFWVYRAAPDPLMLRYMSQIRGKTVALFGTLAAWPDSPHAAKVIENAVKALDGNRVILHFLCQGRLSPQRMAFRRQKPGSGHPMTPERLARLEEAARHPNEDDFAGARAALAGALESAGF